jgi:hypothetical protein
LRPIALLEFFRHETVLGRHGYELELGQLRRVAFAEVSPNDVAELTRRQGADGGLTFSAMAGGDVGMSMQLPLTSNFEP